MQQHLVGAVLDSGFHPGWDRRLVGWFHVSTDDAYVEADIIVIAPKMSGLLAMHKGKVNADPLTFLKPQEDQAMPQATMRTAIVEVVHVTIACNRPFEAVRDALVGDIPTLDPQLMKMLIGANAAEIEERRAAGPKLWLFEMRDHGALVAAEGHAEKAIQFEIGNPLTAERMTRHRLAAGLYAPLRIVLYEDEQGRAFFEHDLPSSLFNQFGVEEVAKIGRELDEELKQALMAAAG